MAGNVCANADEQLNNAILLTRALALGANPFTGEVQREDSVLNNPEVIRTMFFIKDTLEQVAKKGLRVSEPKSSNLSPEFPPEIKEKFKWKRNTSVLHFLDDCYFYTDRENLKKVSSTHVLSWLTKGEFIVPSHDEEYGNFKRVTEKGEKLGLSNIKVEKGYRGAKYITLIFNEKAQKYLVNNMDLVISGGKAPDFE